MNQLRDAQWQWLTGQISSRQLPAIASSMLDEGIYSDSLLALNDAEGCDSVTIIKHFKHCLREFQIREMTPSEAYRRLAVQIAEAICNKQVSPYDGAMRIWSEVYSNGEDREYIGFLGLASEFQDTTDAQARQLLEDDIIDEARILLEENKLATGEQ